MKRHSILAAALLCAAFSFAQAEELKAVALKKPDLARKGTLMEALSKRQSVREYGSKAVGEQELADLLWAANGINRPAEGKRTAPSAMGVIDIDIYVLTAQGAYLFDAKKNTLEPIAAGDHRAKISASQPWVAAAPVSLILVSEQARFSRGDDAAKERMGAMDAGIVSQNVSLFCASAGLATVVRAGVDAEIAKILKLKPTQKIMLNLPVGYAK